MHTLPRTLKENGKQGENIFNYNNSLSDKHQLQYKNVLCNESPSVSLRISALTSLLPQSSPVPSIALMASSPPTSFQNSEYIDEGHVIINGKILAENIVIYKGYDFKGSCTHSCKCQVDIILKNLENLEEKDEGNENSAKANDDTGNHENNHNHQQRICEIEIKNCDCADIGRKLQESNKQVKNRTTTDNNEENHDRKISGQTTMLIKNKNYYRLTSNDKDKSPIITMTTIEDSPSRTSSHEPISTSSTDLLLVAKQIALKMEFLAKNKVVHKDLAARNVLVCADYTIKIADFGISRAVESMTHQVYTSQSDVWSYGTLLYEIVTLGGTPYPSVPNNCLLNLLKSGHVWKSRNHAVKNSLMSSCWLTNPSNRPTFTKIVDIIDEFLMGKPDNHIFSLMISEFSDNHFRMKSVSSEESYLKPIDLK